MPDFYFEEGSSMAVTKVWTIYGSLNGSVKYVENSNKTTMEIPVKANLRDLDKKAKIASSNEVLEESLDNVLKYVSQDYKTDTRHYVTGINCYGPTALEDMQAVKRRFNKKDGAVGYHCIQSFEPGEIDPDTAHLIGLETAAALWGDEGYQVIVCTHLDRNHLHNHFVINSVNEIDGKKKPVSYHKIISATSDRIVKEHGYSVIKDAGMNPSEVKHLTKRQREAKANIDLAIGDTNNLKEFVNYMKSMGYEIKVNTSKAYWTIQKEDWKRPLRMIRLGEDYSNSSILKRIETEKPYEPDDIQFSARDRYLLEDRYNRINNNWKNTYRYKYFVFMLRMGINLNDYRPPIQSFDKEEYRQFQNISKAISYMAENKIDNASQVEDRKIVVEQKIEYLKNIRTSLWSDIKYRRRKSRDFTSQQEQLDELNKELNSLREELSVLDQIQIDNQSQQIREYELEENIDNEKEN